MDLNAAAARTAMTLLPLTLALASSNAAIASNKATFIRSELESERAVGNCSPKFTVRLPQIPLRVWTVVQLIDHKVNNGKRPVLKTGSMIS